MNRLDSVCKQIQESMRFLSYHSRYIWPNFRHRQAVWEIRWSYSLAVAIVVLFSRIVQYLIEAVSLHYPIDADWDMFEQRFLEL